MNHSESSKKTNPVWRTLACLLLAFMTSCTASRLPAYLEVAHMSNVPATIANGSSPEEVRFVLGDPQWAETIRGRGREPLAYVWHYRDDYYSTRGFGNWTVYFDREKRYVGYRMEAGSHETGTREAFYVPDRDKALPEESATPYGESTPHEPVETDSEK